MENASEIDSTFVGGWLPKEWLGEDAVPVVKKVRRRGKSALKRDQIKAFRQRSQWLRAIVVDSHTAGRQCTIPNFLCLDTKSPVPGELYFLSLCQAMYREKLVKQALGEPLEGEDFIVRMVDWWAQGPLESENVYAAMNGTSLDDE
jgi:hypothetical protein